MLSDSIGAGGMNGGLPGDSYRRRQRKPIRAPSSSLLQALDSSLLGSLLKGSAMSGLKEKSADNAQGDVISSGHAPVNGGAQPAGGHHHGGMHHDDDEDDIRDGAEEDEEVSHEDDSEPAVRSGGARSGSGGTGGADARGMNGARDAADANGVDADDEAPLYAMDGGPRFQQHLARRCVCMSTSVVGATHQMYCWH